MKNHSIQFRLCWTSFEIKLLTIEIISKHYIMWNNTGPNLIYFSTSSCLSLGQIELTKYLQFSFTLASSNSVGGGGGPITRSRFWLARGEGGDRYNTTTCGMAKDTKDPCISHVDASHAEWPRTESSLLFCIFFYIVKIIEKSLFYEPEIGFIGKITY
jgi:hypothetical protein